VLLKGPHWVLLKVNLRVLPMVQPWGPPMDSQMVQHSVSLKVHPWVTR
jgi:hypothetical protein